MLCFAASSVVKGFINHSAGERTVTYNRYGIIAVIKQPVGRCNTESGGNRG